MGAAHLGWSHFFITEIRGAERPEASMEKHARKGSCDVRIDVFILHFINNR